MKYSHDEDRRDMTQTKHKLPHIILLRTGPPFNLVLFLRFGTFAESVLGSAGQVLLVNHTTGSFGASTVGLGLMVETTHFLSATVSARRADLLLDVP